MGAEVGEGVGGATAGEVGVRLRIAEDGGGKGVARIAIHGAGVAKLVDTGGGEGGLVLGFGVVPGVMAAFGPGEEEGGFVDGADEGGRVGAGGGEREGRIVDGGADGEFAADGDMILFGVFFGGGPTHFFADGANHFFDDGFNIRDVGGDIVAVGGGGVDADKLDEKAVEVVMIGVEILEGGVVEAVAGDEGAGPGGDTGVDAGPFREVTVAGSLIRAGVAGAADAEPVVGGLGKGALTDI